MLLCVFEIQFFWALGAILEAILALVIMTNVDNDTNWRWLLGVSAVPVGLLSFLFPVRMMSYAIYIVTCFIRCITKIKLYVYLTVYWSEVV